MVETQIKTGTTIVGIVCKDGVVMAADKRASLGGQLVASKKSIKVNKLNDYLVYAGAGSATELQKVGKFLTVQLKLKELKSKKRPTVKESASLLSNIQVEQSAFILGGLDKNGEFSLYEVTGGHLEKIEDFTAGVGSGLMYVLGYLERTWRKDVTVKEGINLAIESVKASSARDMGSGNGVDVYTITKDGINKVVSQIVESVYKDKE